MHETTTRILEEFKRMAPGFYTERDDGPWYVVTPDGDRIAEGFENQTDARRLVIWLAGGELPRGWKVDMESNDLAGDVRIPQRATATIWVRECRQHFPKRFDEVESDTLPAP